MEKARKKWEMEAQKKREAANSFPLEPTRGFEAPTCRLGEPTNTVELSLSMSQKHRIYKGFAIIRCQDLSNEKQLKSGVNSGVY